MSFNALSIVKLGIGFGALAVASIGFLGLISSRRERFLLNSALSERVELDSRIY